jgi:hypothetical protein
MSVIYCIETSCPFRRDTWCINPVVKIEEDGSCSYYKSPFNLLGKEEVKPEKNEFKALYRENKEESG